MLTLKHNHIVSFNFTCSTDKQTPDGIVKIKHWDTIITSENPFGFNLKICPGLSNDDVHPKPYQKMNVGKAYRICINIFFHLRYNLII